MDDYLKRISAKLDQLRGRYPQAPLRGMVSLLFWTVRSLFSSLLRRKKQTLEFQKGEWYFFYRNGVRIPSPPSVAENTVPPFPYSSEIRIDIARALKLRPQTNRIALVFFMGIGDYFYATPFIEKLKRTFSQIPITAYVSDKFDGNNSPLVAQCLRSNPHIEKVELFDGKKDSHFWKNYDYSDVVRKEPSETLILPITYEYLPETLSRDDTLCETFSLPASSIVPLPKVDPFPIREVVENALNRIQETMQKHSCHSVVWTQFRARSVSYTCDDGPILAKRLADSGYMVVSVDPMEIDDERIFVLDLSQFEITDSIALLRLLNQKFTTYCFTFASCFWSISAALKIPNLGIHFRFDPCERSIYYPNTYLVTHSPYPAVPRMLQFIAPKERYQQVGGHNRFRFQPEYLIECFEEMVQTERERRAD